VWDSVSKTAFGSIYANYNDPFTVKLWANGDHARLDPGKAMETDWAVFSPVCSITATVGKKFCGGRPRKSCTLAGRIPVVGVPGTTITPTWSGRCAREPEDHRRATGNNARGSVQIDDALKARWVIGSP
jgi:hypothetical protein